MKRLFKYSFSFLVIIVLFSFKSNGIEQDKVEKILKKNNYFFMENKGQWDDKVLFMAQSKSLRTWLTKNSIIYEQFEKRNEQLDTSKQKSYKAHAVGLEFVNPADVNVKKGEPGTTKYNFIIGNDTSKHKSGVLQYSDCKIENIYEGMDMKYYFEDGELRYDFIVKPGADPSKIEMEIKGSDKTYLKDGDVVMETSLEPVLQKGLNAYQDNKQKKVDCKFKLNGNKLKFEIGEYDKTKELVIDPLTVVDSLVIAVDSTFTDITEIEIDNYNNNIYFVGYTGDKNFPSTFGKYGPIYNEGIADVVIGKIDSALNLVWTTFLGSSGEDRSRAIEIDTNNIYIGGWTDSTNFPTKNALQDTLGGERDGFFSVLTKEGDTLKYSTYFGTPADDMFNDMKRGSINGYIFCVGLTFDPANFDTVNAITTQIIDSIVCQGIIVGFKPQNILDSLSFDLHCSSLFGGNKVSRLSNLDLKQSYQLHYFNEPENLNIPNNTIYSILYISGETASDSLSFNITNGAYKTNNENHDTLATISQIHNADSLESLKIDYNTFYSQCSINFDDYEILPIVVNYNYNIIYFGGKTKNPNLPIVNAFDSILDTAYNGYNTEAFLAAIDISEGGENSLIYSSYFGNYLESGIKSLALVEDCNRVAFAGYTYWHLLHEPKLERKHSGYSNRQIMVGIVDVTKQDTLTLTDLAYLNYELKDIYSNTVKIVEGNNHNIYTAGGYHSPGDGMIAFKLQTPNICSCCDSNFLNIFKYQIDSLNKCYIQCFVEIPSFYSDCYFNFQFEFGDSSLSGEIPQNGRINIFEGLIGDGENFNVTVKLIGLGQDTCIISDSSSFCIDNCPCDSIEKFLDISSENGGEGCDSTQCKVSYSWNDLTTFKGYCFKYISLGSGDKIDFNKYSPPTFPDTCFNSSDLFTTSVSFFRSLSDTTPCTITNILDCSCCNDTGFVFDVLGPDPSCCYRFALFQDMEVSTCDSITNFQTTKAGESEPKFSGRIHGGIDLSDRELCNYSDSTEKYYFEFFSDDTYSDSSKVCTRLIALDPCIDTVAVCCEQINFTVDLVKGGTCPDSLCRVEENWTIPDAKYGCYHKYVNSEGDTFNFDPQNPPDLISAPCLAPGTIIDETIYLLRSAGDTLPCPIHYQAYCPIADIRQGCNPDTCEDDWTDAILVNDTIKTGDCAGCILNIIYKYRNTCGSWQDLQIKEIEKYNPNIDSFLCNCSAEEIYELALKMVISKNDMGFKPKWPKPIGEDSCSIQWRVSQISCWTDWFFDQDAQRMGKDKKPEQQDIGPKPRHGWTVYSPCDSSCCARQLKVCRISEDSVTIDDLGPLSGGSDCDTVHLSTLDCYNTCSYLNNIHYSMLPDINEDEILEIKENINDGLLKLYYDNSKFRIEFYNNEANNIEISIYNLLGKISHTKSEKMRIGSNIYEIDISNLQSGIYVFNISIDGLSFKTGKFTIIR